MQSILGKTKLSSLLVDEPDRGQLRVTHQVDNAFLFQLVERVSELAFTNLIYILQLLFLGLCVDKLKQVEILDAVLVDLALKVNLNRLKS